jgi:PAS domain S-box-containing protein
MMDGTVAAERTYEHFLRTLAEASLAVHSERSLEQTLQVVTDKSREIIGAHASVTSLTVGLNWEQAITALSLSEKYAAWKGYDEKPDGTGIYALVCEKNCAMRLTQAELEHHPRWRGFGSKADKHPPLRGWLAAPLIGRDGANLGVIQLSDKYEGDFTEEDERMLVQFAQIASVAIENVRLYRRAQEEIAERKKIEDKLGLYRLMFAFSNDGIAVIETDGRYVEQNEAHARLIGYSDEELRDCTPAVHLGEETFAGITRQLETTGSFRGEVIIRTKSGVPVHADLSAFTVRNRTGEVVRYVGIKRDISERKRAEHEREELLKKLKAEQTRLERSKMELQEKISDLERFEEVVVGRELKMMALERDLARLQKELDRLKNPPR